MEKEQIRAPELVQARETDQVMVQLSEMDRLTDQDGVGEAEAVSANCDRGDGIAATA